MLDRILYAAVAVGMLSMPAFAEDDISSMPEEKAPVAKAKTVKPVAKPTIRKVDTQPVAKPKKATGRKPVDKKAEEREIVVASAKPTNIPPAADGALLYHDAASKLCIGGVACPSYCADPSRDCSVTMSYVVTLDNPSYISAIQLNAHDNIGKSRRSKLIVKVNGKVLDSKPVFRLGSSVSLKADTVGQVITIESAHQHNGFLRGGEEAMIWDVFVFGANAKQ